MHTNVWCNQICYKIKKVGPYNVLHIATENDMRPWFSKGKNAKSKKNKKKNKGGEVSKGVGKCCGEVSVRA